MTDQVEASKWLMVFLEKNAIDWTSLSQAQKFLLMREIPCPIRCWRVGGPVDVQPGEVCPECGSTVPKQTFWEKLPLKV